MSCAELFNRNWRRNASNPTASWKQSNEFWRARPRIFSSKIGREQRACATRSPGTSSTSTSSRRANRSKDPRGDWAASYFVSNSQTDEPRAATRFLSTCEGPSPGCVASRRPGCAWRLRSSDLRRHPMLTCVMADLLRSSDARMNTVLILLRVGP